MGNLYIFIFSFGLISGIICIFLFRSLALKFNTLLPRPNIASVGGICMGISFLAVCLISLLNYYGNLSKEIMGIIIASFIILVFGVIDDLREVSILAKFLVQLTATTILILSGIRTHIVYIGNLLNISLTLIWVIGITNAFNHLDVIDGLAGLAAMIAGFSFFVISILNSDIKSAILSLALATAVLSFLIYNLPPARIYMGNAGSHFLGFALAAISLGISYAPLERKLALVCPLLILGFPIFDTAFLILARVNKKKLPFKKSNDHIALRFLGLGYSHKQTLLIMSGLALFFSLCGVIISQAPNYLAAITVGVVILLSLILTQKMLKE